MKNIDVRNKDWAMIYNKDNGKMRLSLGNLTDAGWFWSGNENKFLFFLISIASDTALQKEFLKENIDFTQDFKKQLVKNLKDFDGVYVLSGNNEVWHFGGIYNILEMSITDEKIIDEIELSYEDFLKWFDSYYGRKNYTDVMKRVIRDSKNFEEFFKRIGDMFEEYDELIREYVDAKIYEVIN